MWDYEAKDLWKMYMNDWAWCNITPWSKMLFFSASWEGTLSVPYVARIVVQLLKDCFQRNPLQGTKLKYVAIQVNTFMIFLRKVEPDGLRVFVWVHTRSKWIECCLQKSCRQWLFFSHWWTNFFHFFNRVNFEQAALNIQIWILPNIKIHKGYFLEPGNLILKYCTKKQMGRPPASK